jgi:hypothetical protein
LAAKKEMSMKNLLYSLIFLTLCPFATAKEPHQPKQFFCDRTAGIELNHIEALAGTPVHVSGERLAVSKEASADFSRYEGKWVIVDISATWCWFCKTGMAVFENFIDQSSASAVQVHIMFDNNRTDKYAQNLEGTHRFLQMRHRDDQIQGLSLDDIDLYHAVGESMDSLREIQTASGEPYFPGMRGTPYQLIFDPEGQLVFRGHFTNKLDSDGEDGWLAPFRRHYQFIFALANQDVCNPQLSGE